MGSVFAHIPLHVLVSGCWWKSGDSSRAVCVAGRGDKLPWLWWLHTQVAGPGGGGDAIRVMGNGAQGQGFVVQRTR